jgi:hypothetical protein
MTAPRMLGLGTMAALAATSSLGSVVESNAEGKTEALDLPPELPAHGESEPGLRSRRMAAYRAAKKVARATPSFIARRAKAKQARKARRKNRG